MQGNPYRIVMLLFAVLGFAAGLTFAIIALVAEDALRTAVAIQIAVSAGGFAAFWFSVWLIVSAARWQPGDRE